MNNSWGCGRVWVGEIGWHIGIIAGITVLSGIVGTYLVDCFLRER